MNKDTVIGLYRAIWGNAKQAKDQIVGCVIGNTGDKTAKDTLGCGDY